MISKVPLFFCLPVLVIGLASVPSPRAIAALPDWVIAEAQLAAPEILELSILQVKTNQVGTNSYQLEANAKITKVGKTASNLTNQQIITIKYPILGPNEIPRPGGGGFYRLAPDDKVKAFLEINSKNAITTYSPAERTYGFEKLP